MKNNIESLSMGQQLNIARANLINDLLLHIEELGRDDDPGLTRLSESVRRSLTIMIDLAHEQPLSVERYHGE